MEGWVVILIYGIGGLLVIGLAVVVYLFAVGSRKSYSCPQCGERVRTEYLEARRCGHCGAELQREV